MPLAIHLHKNLIHLPLPFGEYAQLLNTLTSDLSSKHRAKPIPPIPDSFVAHVDASLVQQVFDIPKRERETNVQHHCKADDLGTGFEVLERGRIGHGQKLRDTPTPLKQSSSDKTRARNIRTEKTVKDLDLAQACILSISQTERSG